MAIGSSLIHVSDVMKADGWWLALMGYVLRGLIDSLADDESRWPEKMQ